MSDLTANHTNWTDSTPSFFRKHNLPPSFLDWLPLYTLGLATYLLKEGIDFNPIKIYLGSVNPKSKKRYTSFVEAEFKNLEKTF